VKRSRRRMTVVNSVTTSSTNITGFLISVAGLSFTKAWPMAGTTIAGSNSVATGIRLRILEVSIGVTPKESGSEHGARGHRELLHDGAEGKCREECEPAHDDDDAYHETDKERPGCRECAERWRRRLFGCQ